ncbi:hypothetical protein G4Z16_28970 [Streptomyces bathyalis]|uniref:Uncharacterized protein n=1 Tax=Streptomyces bathyalis TaxID=2710756 RepID=A0A7T1TBA7_9ACTN|nr:hypothetical protein [Streptomyces bathyalis]QPP09780.1 hypothetical protein G4Z16_28970 [Streptomyces bathyalis]
MELDDVADELYGLRPQEFTAARDDRARRARAGGQRELAASIRALHRPTLAAWASNLLVREQGQQVAPLLRLGEELRGAHRNLDGAQLRTLSHQQHQLVNALTEQAGRLAADAGQPLSPQARHEVAQTLHAVLADPDAAQEWAAGRLAKPLTATPGFEAAAREAAATPTARRETKAAAGTRPGTARKGTDARPRKQTEKAGKGQRTRRDQKADKAAKAKQAEDARKAARAAREAADQARRRRREADQASKEKAAARAAREEAEERLGRLRAEVREAEEARKHSRSREKEAERSEREARRRAEDAEAAEERARRRADAPATRR